MMKNIWDTVTGNYRYIKYDGSEFHRKKGWSILDRPETKVGLACVAFNCASIAYLNNDLSHILNGDFFNVSNLTRKSLGSNLGDFALGLTLGSLIVNPLLANNYFPKKNKAIDTHGRELSRAQLSLSDTENLKRTKTNGALLSLLYLTLLGTGMIGEDPKLRVEFVMYATTCFMAFERSSKILNGKYVICDDPPKKRGKARNSSTVYGGVRSPN